MAQTAQVKDSWRLKIRTILAPVRLDFMSVHQKQYIYCFFLNIFFEYFIVILLLLFNCNFFFNVY